MKKRKPIPSPPKWFYLETDNCWFCKNRNNCHNCKVLKEYTVPIKRRNLKKLKKYDIIII